MKLSIIIVNYNTYDLTKQTIESVIKEHHNFNYEVILVDNASSDGSINKLQDKFRNILTTKKLHIIINKDNLGFAKANNIGIKFARGKYILLLNSDTVLKENCLEKCIAKMEKDKNIGALGCKVVLANGELDHACKRGFPTPKASLYYFLKLHEKNPSKYGQYNALHLREDDIGEVDCLTGAFMLMPKLIFYKVGGLDEDFFMYGEDIDLCYKIKELGYKILYYPEAQIIHYKGGSSKKKRSKVIYDFHQAMWIFYKKHYYKKYNFAVTFLVFIGIWLKYLVQIIKNSFK
ncbi:glycosyl transferase family 2 [Clostridium sp. 2-1]|uniref:glycosyltransferase family 2 protein n=1 Tax=Clostridium TaxID=1485 RepID=UPI000CDA6B87|nr:glycosyltransferase family 2 protein [Clostridium sp. 2-1]MBN7573228.1 glycosyltransferase family 2 protein [Clostridium beijerinckii]MBN7578567.1 glycosyltransferase family 2 protein [Clostridium beijerinckii]MBN7583002.1 glycosyltransferase family 2 protein [Clostridium beijerinckii]MBO0519195.1 glycosyltransferase family 2 protein [Clostridium beijerinckii]POO89777.1 glycosyl transferase family 2 [Clostridium sp. 2-1]